MFDAIVTVFDRVVSRPGGRSILLAVLVIATIAIGLLSFEAYTAQFRLARLTKTAELVSTIQQIERNGFSKNSQIARAHEALVKELPYLLPDRTASIVSAAPPPVAAKETLWKFLAGGVFWWLVALFALRSVFRKEPGGLTGFLGLVVLGAIAGAIGAAVPTVYWPWLNLVLYPVGHFLVVLLIISGFGMDMVRARSEGKGLKRPR